MTKPQISKSYTDGFDNYLVFCYEDGTEKSFLVQNDELIPSTLPSTAVLCNSYYL